MPVGSQILISDAESAIYIEAVSHIFGYRFYYVAKYPVICYSNVDLVEVGFKIVGQCKRLGILLKSKLILTVCGGVY
jgi:hypothetical protein